MGTDYESVQAAINTMRWADADPLSFYQAIKEQLESMGILTNEQNTQQTGQAPELPEFEGIPESFLKEHLELREKADKFDRFMENYESEKNMQTNQQQLDKIMAELHTKHGRFDEDAVLARMIKGMNPDDAAKDYLKSIQEYISNPQGKQAPPPVLGAGRTAVDQVDSSKLNDPKTRKALVAEILGGIDS